MIKINYTIMRLLDLHNSFVIFQYHKYTDSEFDYCILSAVYQDNNKIEIKGFILETDIACQGDLKFYELDEIRTALKDYDNNKTILGGHLPGDD